MYRTIFCNSSRRVAASDVHIRRGLVGWGLTPRGFLPFLSFLRRHCHSCGEPALSVAEWAGIHLFLLRSLRYLLFNFFSSLLFIRVNSWLKIFTSSRSIQSFLRCLEKPVPQASCLQCCTAGVPPAMLYRRHLACNVVPQASCLQF